MNHFEQKWTISRKSEPFRAKESHIKRKWTILSKSEPYRAKENHIEKKRTILSKIELYWKVDHIEQKKSNHIEQKWAEMLKHKTILVDTDSPSHQIIHISAAVESDSKKAWSADGTVRVGLAVGVLHQWCRHPCNRLPWYPRQYPFPVALYVQVFFFLWQIYLPPESVTTEYNENSPSRTHAIEYNLSTNRGSHGLSVRRARRTKPRMPKGSPARSRGSEGPKTSSL